MVSLLCYGYNPELQEQLASRERLKAIYIELGGQLRDLPVKENDEESWARKWQSGLTITKENPFPVAPPSPLRSMKQKKEPDLSAMLWTSAQELFPEIFQDYENDEQLIQALFFPNAWSLSDGIPNT